MRLIVIVCSCVLLCGVDSTPRWWGHGLAVDSPRRPRVGVAYLSQRSESARGQSPSGFAAGTEGEHQPTGRRGKWDEVRLGGIGETDCAIGARILHLSVRGGAFLDLGRRVCDCA